MKFIAILTQHGEGCDYSIGCGTCIEELKSLTLEGALAEIEDLIGEEYSHEEHKLKSVELHEVVSTHSVDVDRIYSEIQCRKDAQKSNADKENRRQLFEQLSQEFGKEEQ